MIGKPWVWALSARGEQGVSEIIALLKHELKIVMAHAGVSSINDISRDFVYWCNDSALNISTIQPIRNPVASIK